MEKKKEDKKPKNDKKLISKSTRKKLFLIIPLIVVVCILGLVMFSPETVKITSPDVDEEEAKAQLFIDSGNVLIKKEGEAWSAAEDGEYLYQSDSVRTGEDSAATIVLFRSSVVKLDSNTEVTLKEILDEEGDTSVTLEQDSGRTWNTISKVSGIDSYEVETPTTIASVRGTSFAVIVYLNQNGKTDIGVGRGFVNVSKLKEGEIIETIQATINKSVTVDPKFIDLPLKLKEFEKDDWILNNIKEDEKALEIEKQDLFKRIEPYIPELKDRYNIKDEEIEALIEGYLKGYWNIPPNTPQHLKDIFEPPSP